MIHTESINAIFKDPNATATFFSAISTILSALISAIITPWVNYHYEKKQNGLTNPGSNPPVTVKPINSSFIYNFISILFVLFCMFSILFTIIGISKHYYIQSILFSATITFICAYSAWRIIKHQLIVPIFLRSLLWVIISYFVMFDTFTELDFSTRIIAGVILTLISFVFFEMCFFRQNDTKEETAYFLHSLMSIVFLTLAVVSICEHAETIYIVFYSIAFFLSLLGIFFTHESISYVITIIHTMFSIALDYFVIFDFGTGINLFWRIVIGIGVYLYSTYIHMVVC